MNKFSEMETFTNVFQPGFEEVYQKDFRLKGLWNGKYFKNAHPIILELGCGKGEYAVGLARAYPQCNFIGVDIKGARIWTGAKMAVGEDIKNVAFVRSRIEFIESFFGKDEIDEIWITFPGPQLKKRRNKKRLTGSRFLTMYRNFLKKDGLVHLKTDNEVMFSYTWELVKINNFELISATNDLYESDFTGPARDIQTFYEKQFLVEGLNIHYLQFRINHDDPIREPDTE
ncbi:MAG: tRNA (guanosine(46)-N7)-methyltransferase TrmB [Bacteroidales bacterium]|nr:tRNA (guanosine(46)-N7)-methyltransferase TrmB [Bacteroidales bacterium]